MGFYQQILQCKSNHVCIKTCSTLVSIDQQRSAAQAGQTTEELVSKNIHISLGKVLFYSTFHGPLYLILHLVVFACSRKCMTVSFLNFMTKLRNFKGSHLVEM